MKNNRLVQVRNSDATLVNRFRSSAKCGRGASATELIILLVLIAMVCLGVFRLFGDTIKTKLTGAQAGVSSVGMDDKPFEGNFDSSASASSGRSNTSSSTRTGAASQGSTGGGGAIDGSRSAAASSTEIVEVEAKPGSVGGFNPWILAIFIGLGGLLIYVFFAKKSE